MVLNAVKKFSEQIQHKFLEYGNKGMGQKDNNRPESIKHSKAINGSLTQRENCAPGVRPQLVPNENVYKFS